MPTRLRGFCERLLQEPRADVLAVAILLSLSALEAWLTWLKCTPFTDHGWYMQVAARIAAGEVLYRDVLWAYGPLPVYVLSLLYRLLGVDVAGFSLLGQVVAALACLLTYRAARFLLPVPLALLSTVAVFLGGFNTPSGGFLSYVLAYNGAVSLGALEGLAFVVCFLFYLRSRKTIWLVAAGIATAAAFLTKPEFALACAGTGLLFLTGIVLVPVSFATERGPGLRAWATYVASTVVAGGAGYGLLAYQAGWSQVWAGISGYDMAATWGWASYPLGTPQSWVYIVSGLGACLVAGVILIGVASPPSVRRHVLPACGVVTLGLILAVLPWGLLFLFTPGLLSAIASPRSRLIQEALRAIWAPGTVLLSILIVGLAIRWLRACRRGQVISQTGEFCTVLAVYSALAAARFYFNPAGTFEPQYWDTLFPLLVFSVAVLIPQGLERWSQTGPYRSRLHILLAAILAMLAATGFILDVRLLSLLNVQLTTPRGTVRTSAGQVYTDALQYIVSHTEPGDTIAVLDFAPGLYFLSGRKNPLRQDVIMPGIGSSSVDAPEIVRRLETSQPKLVVVPRSIDYARVLSPLGPSDIEQESYENLTPVWQYVHEHYRVRTVVGGELRGYTIYEPVGP